jgi:RNA polymerase sigma-70 factor (ECF subfamily)
MTESDASLVGRVRLGDAAAMDTLLRRYFRASYLVALGRLGNRFDAEDACQDAFIRCVERLDDCREPDKFGAWLLRIVRNTAHNRRDYLRVRSAEPIAAHFQIHSPMRTDDVVQQNELRETLMRALTKLSETQRDVVLLHDLEGWRHAEIAAHLDLSEGMSRRHLSDARKELRELLGDYATLEPDHD